MASVNVQCTVETRAQNWSQQHGRPADYSELFSLSTTDTTYTTDLTAFSTSVYNYYNNEVSGTDNTATSVESNVEIRWTVWVGGDATGGGTTTNDGVVGTVNNATDLKNELQTHVAHALTGDQQAPGA